MIGGGLQGAGVALELSTRGVTVDLYESRHVCLGQASFQNEGKIHLGFIYAKDRTLATARLMAEGGVHFEPIVNRWLETDISSSLLSSPFLYFVHRNSLLDSDELGSYYNAVSSIIREAAGQPGTSYFGADAGAPVRKLSEAERNRMVDSPLVSAIYQTPELAIDPESIAALLRNRLAQDKRIHVHLNTPVGSVANGVDAVTLTVAGCDVQYDHVVNAAWENLLTIDASAGIETQGVGSFRVKYFLRIGAAQAAVASPSVSVALGGFGDVVGYANGDLFLSWYPVGRRGFSSGIKPLSWPMPLGEPEASEVRQGIHLGLCPIMPWLSNLSSAAVSSSDVKGGIIYALGDTDVGDPSSGLHNRHQAGPRSFGRYHSINTGKYTLAPLFAKVTADRILGTVS